MGSERKKCLQFFCRFATENVIFAHTTKFETKTSFCVYLQIHWNIVFDIVEC